MRKPGRRGANTEVIYFLHQWRTVAEVEAECQSRYRLFDRLPAMVRVAINAGDAYIDVHTAATLVRRFGAQAAADMIMERHRAERAYPFRDGRRCLTLTLLGLRCGSCAAGLSPIQRGQRNGNSRYDQ